MDHQFGKLIYQELEGYLVDIDPSFIFTKTGKDTMKFKIYDPIYDSTFVGSFHKVRSTLIKRKAFQTLKEWELIPINS